MGLGKFLFHAAGLARLAIPSSFARNRIRRLAGRFEHFQHERIMERVQYYNQLTEPFSLGDSAIAVNRLPLRKSGSMYYYDFMETARCFPGSARVHVRFGDVTFTHPVPTFVKSRPSEDSPAELSPPLRNSVLLKLDKFRHYSLYRDKIPFSAKRNSAVFRGACSKRAGQESPANEAGVGASGGNGYKPARQELLARYRDHPLLDLADTRKRRGDGTRNARFITPQHHMRHKFIISVEGHDVATNLKWIMASNSVCMMRRPRMASWFMEDRLRPEYHYILLRDDFSDLPEKVEYYSRHTDEALEIVNNAHAFIAQFMDADMEMLISWLVMEKYFRLSGQTAGVDGLSGDNF